LKKAILVVSFGTSYEDARRKCIESIEHYIQEAFTTYEVRRAFTSNFIIKKLKERDGLQVDTVKEALTRLKHDGFNEVYIQPLHIIPGHEYDKIKRQVIPFLKHLDVLKLGTPLLYEMDDYSRVVEALRIQTTEMSKADMVLMMGHGTDHFANGLYLTLQHFIDRANLPIMIGNVEGYPEIDDLLPKLKLMQLTSISIMPFMLVAGDHARNDMAGDDDTSWASRLENEGYGVDVHIRGLGENINIQNIFISKVKLLINEEPSNE